MKSIFAPKKSFRPYAVRDVLGNYEPQVGIEYAAALRVSDKHVANRRRLGCAYFDATKGVLFLLEDTEDGTHWDLTKQGAKLCRR